MNFWPFKRKTHNGSFFKGPYRVIHDRVDFVSACLYSEYVGAKKMLLLVDREVLLDVNARLQTTLSTITRGIVKEDADATRTQTR